MDIKKRKNKKFLHDPQGWFHRLFLNEALLSLLLILCFIGMAYTNVASVRSYHYWLWMIPVLAFAAIISEWSHYRRHEISGYRFIRQQILHWIAGVYVGWRFIVLGLFISLATLLSAYMEVYIWVLIPLAIGIVIVGIYSSRLGFRSNSTLYSLPGGVATPCNSPAITRHCALPRNE